MSNRETSTLAPLTTAPASGTERVGARIPEFTPDDPEVWFCILERNLVTAGISSDGAKVSYVTGALGPRYITEIRDVLMNPPETGLYETLKSELIRRLSVSQEQKARRLLEHEEIGDRRPTQFLRHLRALAGNYISEPLLRTLWLGRLPTNVQAILATQKDTALDKVAELADAILDTMPGRPSIAEAMHAVAPSPMDAVTERMMNMLIIMKEQSDLMKGQIAELRASRQERPFRDAQRRRSTSRRRSSSRNRPRNTSGVCWYHERHGRNARRCTQPCTYGAQTGNATGSR